GRARAAILARGVAHPIPATAGGTDADGALVAVVAAGERLGVATSAQVVVHRAAGAAALAADLRTGLDRRIVVKLAGVRGLEADLMDAADAAVGPRTSPGLARAAVGWARAAILGRRITHPITARVLAGATIGRAGATVFGRRIAIAIAARVLTGAT